MSDESEDEEITDGTPIPSTPGPDVIGFFFIHRKIYNNLCIFRRTMEWLV
jgi:hypothetical protein